MDQLKFRLIQHAHLQILLTDDKLKSFITQNLAAAFQ